MIGGAQGSGVDSSANAFAYAVASAGYNVFGKREYFSNIKGRHSYFTVVASDGPVRSVTDEVHVLTSFDAETVFRHAFEVMKGGALIYDREAASTRPRTPSPMRSPPPATTSSARGSTSRTSRGGTATSLWSRPTGL
jgi:2-oxoglutarate ferredoxin oxidoreductase subunit alpha